MKKYNVNVNGTNYQIEIEEVANFDASKAQTSAPAAKAPVAAPAGGKAVTAPMPGNILDVRITEGASVKKGDILFILEAMKMENEIMAPCDGTVKGLSTSKGATVDTGAVLCTIA